jgi:hypothetical protein
MGVVTAAVLSAAGVAFAQSAARKPAANVSVADKLMANEHKIFDALMKKDAATFSSLVMAGSWSVDESGYMKSEDMAKGISDLKVDSLKASDMKVVPLTPTAALVTYRLDQKGSFQGMPFPPIVYATTVWVDHGGTWNAMFHQESTAAPSKK